MGQQQLLLLVLSTVIVGLAVVVGIEAFSQNRTQANLDALTNQGVAFASDAQAWAMKPPAFGGPSTDTDWSNFEWSDIGVNASTGQNSNTYTTEQGDWTFTGNDGDITFTGTNSNLNNCVAVKVDGTTEDDITTNTNASGTSCSVD